MTGKKSRLKVKLKHLIEVSPLFPVVFLLLPALYLLSGIVNFLRPIEVNLKLLAINFACFILVIAVRFYKCLRRLRRDLCYDADSRPADGPLKLQRPVGQLRKELAEAGYRFAPDGGYGENRNLALLGTTLIYGGVLFALLVGTVDNLRQYSGAVFQGVGNPMELDNPDGYFFVTKGILATTAGLPKLQIKKQILPNKEWPKGATEIALLSKKGEVLASVIVGREGKPLRYRGYEYHFNRDLYDVMIGITTTNNHIEFADMLKLQPLNDPTGTFTYQARFKGERAKWDALFDPERKALRLIGGNNGTVLVADEILFQKEPKKVMGNFVVKFEALSHWSEIHVVRTRHMPILVGGVVIAAIGALLRLVMRPQRVWLEESPEGCRAWLEGSETRRLLEGK
jgi:hypothetical protein